MAKDRLDGTKKKPFLLEFFLSPGRIILWLQYMMPGKGYSAVRQSSRNARSPIMTLLYSLGFWVALGFSIYEGWLQIAFNHALNIIKQL